MTMNTLGAARATLMPLLLAGCAAASDAGGPGGPGTPEEPRTLLGVLDTTIATDGGDLVAGLPGLAGAASVLPFGLGVSHEGVAYVTLHGDVDALVRWDFRTREFWDGVTLTGDEPTNVSFSPDGARAYVAAQLSSRVDVVDVATNAIVASPATPGNDPYQTVVAPDGAKYYASGNAERIWVFNAATDQLVDSILVDADPNGMAITRDGDWMFISHLSSPVIGRIELATGTYDTLAVVGGTPVHGLDVSPDGTTLYIVSQGTDSLYAFNTSSGANVGQVFAGVQPFGLAATPDGGEVWITSLTGDVRRFEAPGLAPITTLHVGGILRRIAVDPAGWGAIIADESGYIVIVK
jgi:YVTN family beta-propeller protein